MQFLFFPLLLSFGLSFSIAAAAAMKIPFCFWGYKSRGRLNRLLAPSAAQAIKPVRFSWPSVSHAPFGLSEDFVAGEIAIAEVEWRKHPLISMNPYDISDIFAGLGI